jgi:peroxiredoxin
LYSGRKRPVLYNRINAKMLSRILLVSIILCAPAWTDALQFVLRDTNNILHSNAEWRDKKAVVLFFTTTDCPLSNGMVPEMNRIRSDYQSRGVAFYAVHADTTIADAEVEKHAREFHFTFPVLLDSKQLLVKWTGATTIPEAAVLSATGRLLYLGRIDNRVEDFEQRRPEPTEFDLRDAIDRTLAGKPPAHARTKAFGCAINRLD